MTTTTPIEPEDWTDTGSLADTIMELWSGGVAGPELFGAIASAGLLLMMWIYSDDLALPTILLLLIVGPFAFAMLPGDLQQIGTGIMAVGVAALVYELARRYIE